MWSWWRAWQLRWRQCVSLDTQWQSYYGALRSQLGLTFSNAKFMAIDLEMTGLNPKTDQIISIGLVPIIRGQARLSGAQSCYIRIHGSVGNSATIHGIVDARLDNALSIDEALQWFLAQSQGYVLLAHHASLELGFLQAAFMQSQRNNASANSRTHAPTNSLASMGWLTKGRLFDVPMIDTLAIEKHRLLRQQDTIGKGSLRLNACRLRYGLPTYDAHDALTDALAAAELFIAQYWAIGQGDDIKVTELLNLSY